MYSQGFERSFRSPHIDEIARRASLTLVNLATRKNPFPYNIRTFSFVYIIG